MSRMKIWLVSREEEGRYDVNHKLVVAAPSPRRARELAAESSQDEGPYVWRDATLATVKLVASAPAEAFLTEQVICVEGRDG